MITSTNLVFYLNSLKFNFYAKTPRRSFLEISTLRSSKKKTCFSRQEIPTLKILRNSVFTRKSARIPFVRERKKRGKSDVYAENHVEMFVECRHGLHFHRVVGLKSKRGGYIAVTWVGSRGL